MSCMKVVDHFKLSGQKFRLQHVYKDVHFRRINKANNIIIFEPLRVGLDIRHCDGKP